MASTSCWRCVTRPMAPASRSLVLLPSRPIPSPTTLLSPAAVPAITGLLVAVPGSAAHLSTTSAAYAGGMVARAKPKSAQSMAHAKMDKYRISVSLAMKSRAKKKDKMRAVWAAKKVKLEPGERKAWRKRVTLTNSNAFAVEGMQDIGRDTLAAAASAGQVWGLPQDGDVVDRLRTLETFKPSQSWALFRRPAVLVREQTVELVRDMDACAANKEALRVVVDGDRAAGKSTLLLQVITHAFLNGWTVVHIPDARDMTMAQTEYSTIPGTSPRQWSQPSYITKVLRTTLKANPQIAKWPIALGQHKGIAMPASSSSDAGSSQEPTLGDLINTPQDPSQAWPHFAAVWRELTQPPGRPPLLFAVDCFNHVFRNSEYRDPDFTPVHALDFVLPRLFAELLAAGEPGVGGTVAAAKSDKQQPSTGAPAAWPWADLAVLPNGGAVVGANSKGVKTPSVALSLGRRLLEQQQQQQDQAAAAAAAAALPDYPVHEPYGPDYDARAEAALKSVKVVRLPGLTRAEARALLTYWARSGLLGWGEAQAARAAAVLEARRRRDDDDTKMGIRRAAGGGAGATALLGAGADGEDTLKEAARIALLEKSVAEKWVVGGRGVVGEMERLVLGNSRMAI